MLQNNMNSVIVGNYLPELESLRGLSNIYFAGQSHASGILEAVKHFIFGDNTQVRQQ